MSACPHKKWARQLYAARPAPVLVHELVLGRPEDACPWCARDAGRKLADDMMSRLIRERDAAIESLKLAREAFTTDPTLGAYQATLANQLRNKALAAIEAVLKPQ